MRSCRCRKYFISITLLFVVVGMVFAGTTGKIAGRVIDEQTGEALIGVTVLVKGTSLGASTDFDGYYTILYVPPGTHTIVASMVGYAPVSVNEVRVLIDQTATVDIKMTQRVIETGAVEVVAERNVVKKDVSTSVAAVQSEEIQSLPVSTISEVVGLQAGVDDGLIVRGGSADELLLQIDGVTQRDPRNNSPISTVALTSIEEVSIEKGGFNAEYGQVQSGVINIVAKEGSTSKYTGAIQVRYSPPAPKHFGVSVYDPNSMWSRPYLDPAVCWTGTDNGAWDDYTVRQYPKFPGGWNAVSERLLKDDDPTNDLSPAAAQRVWQWEHRRRPLTDQPDYTIDASFGGPVPVISSLLGNLRFFTSYILEREMFIIPLTRDDYREYNWSTKVNSDISNDIKLMLSATTGTFYTSAINTEENFLNNPSNFGITDGVLPYNPTEYFRSPISIAQMLTDQRDGKIYSPAWYSDVAVSHLTLAGKLSHVITSTTFYEVSAEHVRRKYQVGQMPTRNNAKTYEVVPGYFVDEAPYGYTSSNANSPISGMMYGGHSGELIDSSVVNSYKIKVDLTSQINKSNMVKLGVEFNTYDLKLNYKELVPGYGGLNAVNDQWQPYQFSAYLQDKIEMFGFIANLGLRMDVSNPNTEWVVVDDFNKSFYGEDHPDVNYPKEKAKVDVAFSPRIGISHPITENSKLYFNYGHFKQLPAYQEIFRLGRGSTGSLSNVGDPNLIQAKTVAYELGYDHVLFDYYLLQIQAYYRDISDVQGYTNYTSETKSIGYTKATNNNYSDIRGFEATFRKSEGDWVRGLITYTYQVTTNGAFGRIAINDNPSDQRRIDRTTKNLYQQKPLPQPRGRASVTFLTPKDFGPKFAGIRPLDNWSVNVLGDWRAGAWMNYYVFQVDNPIPNVQCSDYFNMDLRINKSFSFDRFSVMVFMEINNLFNTKRLSGVGFYDGFDQQDYFKSLHLPESVAYDNIPGDDRIGEYRDDGVAFQPIEHVANISSLPAANASKVAKYYDKSSKKYYEVVNGNWAEVSSSVIDKILDDKAYIDMPNNTSFNFLDPRQIFFGINLSFNF